MQYVHVVIRVNVHAGSRPPLCDARRELGPIFDQVIMTFLRSHCHAVDSGHRYAPDYTRGNR